MIDAARPFTLCHGAIEIRTLAASITALGGSLEITAQFAGEPIILSASP